MHGAGFQGVGCKVQGSGCKVQGARFRVQGSRCKVQGARFKVLPLTVLNMGKKKASPHNKINYEDLPGLGGSTRARTLDPLIMSQML